MAKIMESSDFQSIEKFLEAFSCDVICSYSLSECYDIKSVAFAVQELLKKTK